MMVMRGGSFSTSTRVSLSNVNLYLRVTGPFSVTQGGTDAFISEGNSDAEHIASLKSWVNASAPRALKAAIQEYLTVAALGQAGLV